MTGKAVPQRCLVGCVLVLSVLAAACAFYAASQLTPAEHTPSQYAKGFDSRQFSTLAVTGFLSAAVVIPAMVLMFTTTSSVAGAAMLLLSVGAVGVSLTIAEDDERYPFREPLYLMLLFATPAFLLIRPARVHRWCYRVAFFMVGTVAVAGAVVAVSTYPYMGHLRGERVWFYESQLRDLPEEAARYSTAMSLTAISAAVAIVTHLLSTCSGGVVKDRVSIGAYSFCLGVDFVALRTILVCPLAAYMYQCESHIRKRYPWGRPTNMKLFILGVIVVHTMALWASAYVRQRQLKYGRAEQQRNNDNHVVNVAAI
ncbi:unnamed protein product (mitochondrion) [Plasmodiophora brassicae]|uniref:Uncharacterized protein n=1 Tax=Plasmodiophora brassicae TaxID=37360 RepID=A0A0G4J548_PLABS|nr:hypothetical protein PBRA_009005 [Plasmodiophora brassicae]SPQ99919.1 unnamed protein product [Plasmodiophora brassicae]